MQLTCIHSTSNATSSRSAAGTYPHWPLYGQRGNAAATSSSGTSQSATIMRAPNQDEELNRFATEIKDRLCNFSAHDLKKNEILRVATATDAAQILSQMDAVLRGREHDPADTNDKSTTQNEPSVEAIFSHMSAYMEAATP